MEHDINALTQERTALLDSDNWNDETEARLYHLEHLMNQHHKRSKVFFRNGVDYKESTPAMVGNDTKQIFEGKGGFASVFFNSHVELPIDSLLALSPCENYDYTNEEHQKMMLEKYVITLTGRCVGGIADNRFSVNAELRFSYYEEDAHRDMTVDIYVNHNQGCWNRSGCNWSAMGTTSPHIADIYGEMIKMSVDIHNSIRSQGILAIAKLTKPIDNSGQV